MFNRRFWLITVFILFSIASTFFSLYSVTSNTWIWFEGRMYQKVLGTASGLVAFSGIIATIKFWKRQRNAYFWAIGNSLLLGIYALSINLTGDFLVNLLWFVPLFIYFLIQDRKNKQIKIRRLRPFYFGWLIILFVIAIFFFWFLTPLINEKWAIVVKTQEANYGNNFDFYWFARILDTVINATSLVVIIMMILGIPSSWLVWIVKDTCGILFFAGIGVLQVSICALNFIYLIISIYIYWKILKEKKMHIAILGPGAVGKSTIIKYLKPFLEKHQFQFIYETQMTQEKEFDLYMLDMKKYAFDEQKAFFKYSLSQVEEMQFLNHALIERHLIDNFAFPLAHIKSGNFNSQQIKDWKKIERKYWNKLLSIPKINYVFVVLANDEIIEKRRKERSLKESNRKHEVKNKSFFKKVNAIYHEENSIFYQAVKTFAKQSYVLKNYESKKTAKQIEMILSKKIKK